MPQKFNIISYDDVFEDITQKYPGENFLRKFENKLRDLGLPEDVISTLLINSTSVNWPEFAKKKPAANQKTPKNENIQNLKEYTCK